MRGAKEGERSTGRRARIPTGFDFFLLAPFPDFQNTTACNLSFLFPSFALVSAAIYPPVRRLDVVCAS
jgi:hypothetical protein